MTKQERIAERHSNIAMLSELLEASLGYDKRAQDCAAKKAEIDRLDRELKKQRPKKFQPRWLFILLGIITFGIGLIFMLIVTILDKKKWEKRNEALRAERERAKKIFEEACAELERYDNEEFKPAIAKYVPENFAGCYARSSFALQYMLNLCTNLRADTIREIINLFEESMHRARVEKALSSLTNLSVSIAKNTARTAEASESAASYAAMTAANTTVIAASSTATAYNTSRIADRDSYYV